MIKTCEYCKSEFETKVKRRKFCSASCSAKHRASDPVSLAKRKATFEKKKQTKLITTICEFCSNEFTTFNKIKRFCTDSCSAKWRNSQPGHSERISDTLKQKYTKICEYCRTEYNGRNKKFCSFGCSSKAQRKPLPKITNCEWCSKEFQPTKSTQKCCSRSCSSFHVNNRPEVAAKKSKVLRENGNLKGEKNPSYGKTPSKETKERLSIASIEYCKKHGNSFKGKKHSNESKDRMSKSRVEWMISNGGDNANNKNYITGYYFSTKNQEELWHDSSYELRAYKLLDQASVVKSYGRCDFSIKYLHEDGTTHRYIPDILIKYTDGREEVIEIKPTTKLKEDLNVRKFKAGNKKYKDSPIRYVVWTEKKLKKLEEEMT